jgi:hypothetical protein
MRRAKRARPSAPRLALLCAAAWAGACARPAPEPPAPPPPAAVSPPPAAACERIERIVVRKSERVLIAACAGGGELRLPVALARAPGPKRASGDQRMPEGDYRIAGPPRPSRFHRFVPIDYPSPADAARALAEGRLGRAEHDAIVRAHAAGRLPPQDTVLGGSLGIHGEGRRWRGEGALDWTEGCVALGDHDVEELGRLAPPGTPVRIEP